MNPESSSVTPGLGVRVPDLVEVIYDTDEIIFRYNAGRVVHLSAVSVFGSDLPRVSGADAFSIVPANF